MPQHQNVLIQQLKASVNLRQTVGDYLKSSQSFRIGILGDKQLGQTTLDTQFGILIVGSWIDNLSVDVEERMLILIGSSQPTSGGQIIANWNTERNIQFQNAESLRHFITKFDSSVVATEISSAWVSAIDVDKITIQSRIAESTGDTIADDTGSIDWMVIGGITQVNIDAWTNTKITWVI